MPSRSAIVLQTVLHAARPLVRLLLRNGVAYPAFAAALKSVFLDVARDELRREGAKATDSALSLRSGVHRRDVRTLTQAQGMASPAEDEAPMNMAAQVVARWLATPDCLDDAGLPRPLPRAGEAPSFEALVAAISTDVRPRAVLDELARLGMAEADGDTVRLLAPGFVPHQGFAEMAFFLQHNLHDHAAAAVANLADQSNYLEQAVFVDDLSAASAQQLHATAAKAWRQAFKTVMHEAQALHDHDRQSLPAAERGHRARFGTFFFTTDHDDPAS